MLTALHIAIVLSITVICDAQAQTWLGTEFRAGTIKPSSYAPSGSSYRTNGSLGATSDLRITLCDSISPKFTMNYSVGYQHQWYSVSTTASGLGSSTKNELNISSGWMVLGIAPGWALSRDHNTTADLGWELMIPVYAIATGNTGLIGLTGSSTTTYDHETIQYGKANARFVFRIQHQLISDNPYALKIGIGSGFGFLNESKVTPVIRTWQALVSIAILWNCAKKTI